MAKRMKKSQRREVAEMIVRYAEDRIVNLDIADAYSVLEEVRNMIGGRMMDLEEEDFDRQATAKTKDQ